MHIESQHKKGYLLVEVALIICVFTCIVSIANRTYINFDESFSINLINNSWKELISLTALDVHPPLYYLILKLFTVLLGNNFVAYYAPSVLSYIALIIVSYLFFTKYFSQKAAVLISLAFSAAPNMLTYALQIRMYSLAMLLVTLSFYGVYILSKRILEKGEYAWSKYWFTLAVINALAAYTHYFAGVAAVAISFFLLAYLLIKGTEKKKIIINWCIYCVVMLVLYLPWIPVLFTQMSTVGEGYWIAPLTETALHYYPDMLLGVSNELYEDLLIAAYIIGTFLFLFYFKRNHENYWIAGCYGVILIWLALGIGYSALFSPILVSRYMVILFPLFWIPICLSYVKPETQKYSAGIFLLFTLCFSQSYDSLYYIYDACYQGDRVTDLGNQLTEDDVLFYTNMQELCTYKAFFPEATSYAIKGCDSSEVFHYWPELTDCTMIEHVKELKNVSGNIWVFDTDYITIFQENGWQVEETKLGTGTMFRMYQ